MPIKSVKMKISKNKKMRFFLTSQGSLDPKIRFIGQKVCSVVRAGIKDFNLPDKVSGALKILPDISKIYRTFQRSTGHFQKVGGVYLVAFSFFIFVFYMDTYLLSPPCSGPICWPASLLKSCQPQTPLLPLFSS